ncbi:MAG TPA: outer membrane protein transport protein, partial [Thermoanaerobaculia bacterium]|nr:outer membrane protein transport protein [Thermoanaerobaculia bacterium]
MRLSRFTICLILLITCLVSPAVFASGFSIFEQGAKATGMGGAFAATADDPSAMFYNVAGIAQQRKTAALTGATIITFENEFRGSNDAFPGSGVGGRYEDHVFTPPNVYAIVPIGENATFGIATFSGYGLRTNWEDANRFAGRFLAQDTNLKTVSIQPSFA